MTRGLMKTASGIAIAAAAGLFATTAQAADLGGNCCADLEERVAELEATTARKGNRKVSLTVYGQVNKALLWHDDDSEGSYREGKLTVRDNDAGQSRFGFRGEAKIRPDLAAGYQIEIGVTEDKGTGSDKGSLYIRHNFVYLDSQSMGRVSLGQTSQVTDGLYEINLARTHVTPGGMDESGDFLSSTFTGTFKTPFDGGRKQGVYYRTPTLAGFVLSAGWSHGTQDSVTWVDADDLATYKYDDADEAWEVALRYAGEFNGVRIAAGIGYRHEKDNTATFKEVPGPDPIPPTDDRADADIWLGSGSIMHTPTGLFVSGGYARMDSENNSKDQDGWWVMAGIEKNFFGPGNTTLFGEYSEVDFKNAAKDGNYWGLGVVQQIDAAAADLYLNFRNYELDSGDDANVVVGGMIIRF